LRLGGLTREAPARPGNGIEPLRGDGLTAALTGAVAATGEPLERGFDFACLGAEGASPEFLQRIGGEFGWFFQRIKLVFQVLAGLAKPGLEQFLGKAVHTTSVGSVVARGSEF
jgi:hypothetical protein